MSKLPIIATTVSAIPEFIQHNVHGLLAEDTAEHFAEAIAELTQNTDKRAALADAAYQRLVENFGMDAGIRVLDRRLNEMVARSSR